MHVDTVLLVTMKADIKQIEVRDGEDPPANKKKEVNRLTDSSK